MEKNSATFSHRTFWFLRGIEERVKWETTLITGKLNLVFLQHPEHPASETRAMPLDPRSVQFLGTPRQLTAVLSVGQDDRVFLYGGADYVPLAAIDLGTIRAHAIHRVGNKLCLLDTTNRSLCVLDLRFSTIEQLLAPIGTATSPAVVTISIATLDHEFLSLEGIPLGADTRFIAWETQTSLLRLLAWQHGTPNVWVATANERVARFEPTDLAAREQPSARVEIADACFHDAAAILLILDRRTARLVRVQLDDSRAAAPLFGVVIAQDLKIESGPNLKLSDPTGLAVYHLSDPEDRSYIGLFKLSRRGLPFGSTPSLSSQKSEKIELLENHAFTVVVDPRAEAAISVEHLQATARVLPLVGNFSAKSKRQALDNLATVRLGPAEKVTRGPCGSLLFWSPGRPHAWLLDPGLAAMANAPRAPGRKRPPVDFARLPDTP